MPTGFKTLEATVSGGGALLTRLSKESVGIQNYTVKRGWRRDLDREVRREGHDFFWPNVTGSFSADPGQQPFPLEPGDAGPITLIHECVRPNGQRAIIAATPTRIYRFCAMDNGAVFETGVFDPGVFETNPGQWIVIGRGFSASGRRWEAVNINGYAFLSNGVDLPVTYRVEDNWVKPVYELREQGYSCVGTVAAFKDIQMVGDVTEINLAGFELLFRPLGVSDSGDILGTQAGNTVTTNEAFFTLPANLPADAGWGAVTAATYWTGRTIVWDDGTSVHITGWTNSKTVTVGAVHTVAAPGQRFGVRVRALQTGCTPSGAVTGSVDSVGDPTLHTIQCTAGPFTFNAGMIGKRFRFANGWSSVITGVPNPTHATVTDAAPEVWSGYPFWIVSDREHPTHDYTDYTVTAAAPIFYSAMAGLTISWDDGTTRWIDSTLSPAHYISPTQVIVDGDMPIANAVMAIENPDTYAAYPDGQYTSRLQYRIAWGMNNEPRRFGTVFKGSVAAGSNVVLLDYPIKSLESGTLITITGAGLNEGNLQATAIYVAANRIVTLDAFASTAVTSANIVATDALGGISGYDDPPGDFSGILRMKELSGTLVVYKDASLEFVSYTGDVTAPFAYKHKTLSGDQVLHFRHTLCQPDSRRHVYAGRKSIVTLDMITQDPETLQSGEGCADVFFTPARIADKESIFGAVNPMNREIWFTFGGSGSDRSLVWDYYQDTWSTDGRTITAAATVGRPMSGLVVGETENWFLMTKAGTMLTYGRAIEPVGAWSPNPAVPTVNAIYYQRDGAAFAGALKNGYVSTLTSGLEAFGARHSEKALRAYVVHLGSDSGNYAVSVALLGARNTAETITTLCTVSLPSPTTGNLIPVHYSQHFFGDTITVPSTVQANVTLAGRTLEITGVDVKSWSRQKV